jgi:predicted glycoside hydrolase/deacetylase ChbG (UPF0249 family)
MLALLSNPELAKVYVDLGREYHLPILIWPGASDNPEAASLKLLANSVSSSFVKPFMIEREFPGPRGTVDNFADMYRKAILEGQPNEVIELVVHPGIKNDELTAAIGDGSYGSSWREADYQTIISTEMRSFLEQNHVKPVSWKQLTAAGLINKTSSKDH